MSKTELIQVAKYVSCNEINMFENYFAKERDEFFLFKDKE